jgi:hypothetical protein
MRSPYVAYFAGISTVVAALAVGFGGGLLLTDTSAVKSAAAVPTATQARTKATNPDAANSDAMQAQKGKMTPRVVSKAVPAAEIPQVSGAHVETVVSNKPDGVVDLLAASAKVPVESAVSNINRVEPAALMQTAPQIQTRDAAAGQALSAKKLAAEKKQADRRKYAREHEAMEHARLTRENADDEDDARAEAPGARTTIIRRYEARSDRYYDDGDE